MLYDKKYFQLSLVCKSKYKEVLNRFVNENQIIINCDAVLCTNEPWGDNNKQIDLTFLDAYSKIKEGDPKVLKETVENIIVEQASTFENLFFVDGSVDNHGKVGAAIFAPSLNIKIKIKLPDHLSVYYAEGCAVLHALTLISNLKMEKYCIISDNAKVLQDLKFCALNDAPHPHLNELIANHINDNNSASASKIMWLPGHAEHPYLALIDSLAKSSSSSPLVPSQASFAYFSVECGPIIET